MQAERFKSDYENPDKLIPVQMLFMISSRDIDKLCLEGIGRGGFWH
jgi:hypothetical protein